MQTLDEYKEEIIRNMRSVGTYKDSFANTVDACGGGGHHRGQKNRLPGAKTGLRTVSAGFGKPSPRFQPEGRGIRHTNHRKDALPCAGRKARRDTFARIILRLWLIVTVTIPTPILWVGCIGDHQKVCMWLLVGVGAIDQLPD